jgi:hypothetical protein
MLTELFISLIQDKGSILKWLLLQPKKLDGFLTKGLNTWVSELFKDKMVKSSRQGEERM